MNAPNFICFPPAPLNGGKLEDAPPKVGDWVWQPKVDDWRAVVHVPTSTVWNQYGELSSHSEKGTFAVALAKLQAASMPWAEWLDVGMMNNRNDMMRGSIVVLDWITPAVPFEDRRTHLTALAPTLPWATELVADPAQSRDAVYLIPQVEGEDMGRFLDQMLRDQNAQLGRKFYEGVVAKRLGSPYRAHNQRPKQKTCDWVKHRFDQ